MSGNTSPGSAVLTADSTTCITSKGRAGSLPPDVYAIVDIDGAAEQGEMFVVGPDGELVAISSVGVQIAEGAKPFISYGGHRVGMVAGTCGHAVAGTEWLAGYRVCEQCAV